jgi:hypothetical protein
VRIHKDFTEHLLRSCCINMCGMNDVVGESTVRGDGGGAVKNVVEQEPLHLGKDPGLSREGLWGSRVTRV